MERPDNLMTHIILRTAKDRDSDEPLNLRTDEQIIVDMIPSGARVLDVGCGDGTLLTYLTHEKSVHARGLEIEQALVSTCLSRGLSVIQGNAEEDLGFYPDASFDYVVLSQTIQAMSCPKNVLTNLLRVGRHVIVSFPNFGYWRVRWQLLLGGRMPVSDFLKYEWYETPNIHFCTIRDFYVLMAQMNVCVEKAVRLNRSGQICLLPSGGGLGNLLGEQAVFLLCSRLAEGA